MNATLVNRIADAVLYEGYILYPYRPSVKNRQRWTFGGLYPESWCRIQSAGDASSSQTECLVHGTPATTFEVAVRFLHLTARIAGEIDPTFGGMACQGRAVVPARRGLARRRTNCFRPGRKRKSAR